MARRRWPARVPKSAMCTPCCQTRRRTMSSTSSRSTRRRGPRISSSSRPLCAARLALARTSAPGAAPISAPRPRPICVRFRAVVGGRCGRLRTLRVLSVHDDRSLHQLSSLARGRGVGLNHSVRPAANHATSTLMPHKAALQQLCRAPRRRTTCNIHPPGTCCATCNIVHGVQHATYNVAMCRVHRRRRRRRRKALP